MSCGEEKHPWSVFDGVKAISIAPEPLMAEINSAIAALEYARAAAFSQSPDPAMMSKNANKKSASYYDSQIADEAYKAGLASMTVGRVDEAVISLNIALSKCPPEKTSAVSKIQSLISLTSQPGKKSSNRFNS
ncbi:hypothetical protein C2S52_000795 [Perilla frutescens var. hirtella]|uniref:Uncharacterized protein n=1 Tax=Perilla frutescens var. hirtella TaxID=608512 RepID=A0AAD4J886_PERFH|nr:hypothetical protein C2S51_007644 [Perilla frutescens var. frutescens]KAH6800331.1 hypothetical protein C2S52_000795 [Perilla frutescens var. hirtella]KAH6828959.1 hypothetical protein C2S53_000870 [Perilla frutescens var. hirtella]